MAYVVLRVLRKKYNQVRIGLKTGKALQLVGPGKSVQSEDEPTEDDASAELNRSKSLTKSQRVKTYIQKKCQQVERVRSRSKSGSRVRPDKDKGSVSWYVDPEDSRTEGGTNIEEASQALSFLELDAGAAERLAAEISTQAAEGQVPRRSPTRSPATRSPARRPRPQTPGPQTPAPQVPGPAWTPAAYSPEHSPDRLASGSTPDQTPDDSPCRTDRAEPPSEQPSPASLASLPSQPSPGPESCALECLVDVYLGTHYPNYPGCRPTLVRQARDLLVTKYMGSLSAFETEFCVPASRTLQQLSLNPAIQWSGGCGVGWWGWPLSKGKVGVVVHLGRLEAGLLASGDSYLALEPELVLHVRRPARVDVLHLGRLGPPTDLMDDTLVDSLSALLVSVERALERVPLEGLAFGCGSCGSGGRCREHGPPPSTRDSAIQTAPVHELDPSIPHIDSDDEHEPNSQEGCRVLTTLCPAKRLSDIPDYHLNAGIYLPGLHDAEGRAIIVINPNELSKSGITLPECARILLYYSSLPVLESRTRSGVCILCLDGPMDIVDQTLYLVAGQVMIGNVILYTPERHGYYSKILPESQTEIYEAKSLGDLERYISRDQVPCWCGGPNDHDQEAWVHFFKEAERVGSWCQEAGRRLAAVLGEVARGGRCASSVVRDADTLRLRRDAPALVSALADASARHLADNEDARLIVERVGRIFSEVDRTVNRLEELAEKRREKLKDITRIRALEQEAEKVLSWLNHKGDEWLRKHSELASNLPALKQQEIDFEKFYFISMRHLEKGGDLVEEAGQCSGSGGSALRELARTLKSHLLGFTDRLEDTRERLEDASRCYYLLDRSLQWSVEVKKLVDGAEEGRDEGGKHLRQYLMAHPTPSQDTLVEMTALANKLGYDKLITQSNAVSKQCEDTVERVRTVLGWVTACDATLRRSSDCDSSLRRQSDCDPSIRRPSDCESGFRRVSEYDPSEWQNGPRPWQHHYPHHSDTDTDDDKHSSSITTDGSESCNKSSYDESLDYCLGGESGDTLGRDTGRGQELGRKALSPIPVNTHLLADPSTALLPNANSTQTLKNKKTMLLIMREMIQTERDYVQSLEYVIDNYIPELVREDIPQAMRGQRNVIFGNIEKIYEFHSQYFLQELERCESSPLNVGQCFLKYESKFYLYALYNKNKPKSDSLMSEYGTLFFKGKQLELGDKMDLASYLLKPVQRMGKYALLLQQLMKASPRHDSPVLRAAETMVRFQLRHGNDLLAMDSLRDCDVNVKEQGRLLRQNEFLVWQGKNGKKYYRHVFLFEELILFSKAKRFPDRKNLDIYIYKQSIKTSDIGLTAKVGDSSTKFEIWFRKRKPNDTYTLQAISEEVKQAWAEELSNLLWKQAMRNRELRLAEMSSMGIGNKPCLDIRPSANQISDRSISITQLVKGGGTRLRNSIAVSPVETVRKRPHSIISVSSSSSSSSSSSGSVASGDHKHSQCSSTESGIVADWSPQPTTTSVKL